MRQQQHRLFVFIFYFVFFCLSGFFVSNQPALGQGTGSARHPSYPEIIQKASKDGLAWDKVKLENSKGKDFTLESFRGKLLLINFFFTSCPDICPPQTAGLQKTWNKLGRTEKNSIRFVSISIDPKNDSLATIEDYRERFKIATDSWIFARGSEENVKALAEHFGSLTSDKGPLEHRARIYLMDPKGQYLLSYASAPVIDSNYLSKELTAAVRTFVRPQLGDLSKK